MSAGRAHRLLDATHLEERLRRANARGRTVPLLLLRVAHGGLEPAVAQHFVRAAARVVRRGDQLAHEPGSLWYAVAMLSPSRCARDTLAFDARAALERLAAVLAGDLGVRAEFGWWPVTAPEPLDQLIARALERGARERERLELLATVGHELRTPLTSIRGFLETLIEDELDAATARRFLTIARDEALRLGRLVDGMLEYSLHDPAPQEGRTDVARALRDAAQLLAPMARSRTIRVIIRAPERADAAIAQDACARVLINLLENGLKYGRAGGQLTATLERQDPYLCLILDDDGPGIARGERERIFERRARGRGAHGRPGNGLGLAIVRSIVERAQGSIAAGAAPGGGARFVVRLPAAKAGIVGAAS